MDINFFVKEQKVIVIPLIIIMPRLSRVKNKTAFSFFKYDYFCLKWKEHKNN